VFALRLPQLLFSALGWAPLIADANRPGWAALLHLRWIRDEFLDDERDHGKVVVHGHTICDDVEIFDNRIGIDTGAYCNGRLTAIGLEGEDRWFLSAVGEEHREWRSEGARG